MNREIHNCSRLFWRSGLHLCVLRTNVSHKQLKGRNISVVHGFSIPGLWAPSIWAEHPARGTLWWRRSGVWVGEEGLGTTHTLQKSPATSSSHCAPPLKTVIPDKILPSEDQALNIRPVGDISTQTITES